MFCPEKMDQPLLPLSRLPWAEAGHLAAFLAEAYNSSLRLQQCPQAGSPSSENGDTKSSWPPPSPDTSHPAHFFPPSRTRTIKFGDIRWDGLGWEWGRGRLQRKGSRSERAFGPASQATSCGAQLELEEAGQPWRQLLRPPALGAPRAADSWRGARNAF